MKKMIVIAVFLIVNFIPFSAYAEKGMNNEAYALEALTNIQQLFDREKEPGKIYPNDIAGLGYLDDAKIFVGLISPTEARKAQIATASKHSDLIVFYSAKYSFNELDAIIDDITLLPFDNPLYGFMTASVREGPNENYVLVQVTQERFHDAHTYSQSEYGDRVIVKTIDNIINPPKTGDRERFMSYGIICIILSVLGFYILRIAKSNKLA